MTALNKWIGESLVAGAQKQGWGQMLGYAALSTPSVLSLGGLAYNLYNWWDQNKKEKSMLEEQNKLRLAREKAENERLAQMRAMNYANNAVYEQQTSFGLSQIRSASMNAGISIYSGYTQKRLMQYEMNRERTNYLNIMRQSHGSR